MRPSSAVIFGVLAFLAPANAQTVRFEHLTVADGISQDIVTSIAQDDQGFLWFGTEDGLNRFDGSTVTVFKHDPHDSTSIVGNDITCLWPGVGGNIWVGTATGADLFESRTKKFHHIACSKTGGQDYSTSNFCDGNGSGVYIGTSGGLYYYSNGVLIQEKVDGVPFAHNLWGLYADEDRIWLADTSGLHCFASSEGTLRPLSLPPTFHIFDRDVISQVLRDADHGFWVATGKDGVYQFDRNNRFVRHLYANAQTPFAIGDNAVRVMIQDHSGAIWLGTMSGLERLDPVAEHVTHFQGEAVATSGPGLLGTRVYSLFLDRTGIVWVGTYRGGLNSYARSRLKFKLVCKAGNRELHDVFAVTQTSAGAVIVGTDRGMIAVNPSGDEPYRMVGSAVNAEPVYALSRRTNGELLVGTDGRVEQLTPRFAPSATVRLPNAGAVRCIREGPGGMLWIGTELHGLYNAGRSAGKATRWNLPHDTLGGGVWSLFTSRSGDFWIGTWNDDYSYRLDSTLHRVLRYGIGNRADVFLQYPSIRAFREDAAGTLWLACWGGGVYHLDSDGKNVRHFTEIDGLASDFTKSLELDRRGRVWVGTERGLSCLDPTTDTFKTYTPVDGLPSSFFYSGASYKNEQGTLFFGTNNGLIAFDPDSIPQNSTPPLVAITGFKVFDKSVLPALSATGTQDISLRYDQNFFSFEYIALDFTAPPRNRYAYKLDGVDRDWIQAGSRTYASYTHLDAGSYTFHVKASNNDGVWNVDGASITVTIAPPFWSTWWFRTLSFGLALTLGYRFYRYRLGKIQEVERLRRRIARDLHDEIGTNLSAIVLASQMAGRGEVPSGLNEYVASMKSLATETQEHMRNIVWMLNPKNDPPEMLLTKMKDEAARLLCDIPYGFESPEKGLPATFDLNWKRQFFLIYKEALHNIARHSRATSAGIAITCSSDNLELLLTDNGRGFDPLLNVTGNGIENMKTRAQQMGAELQIESAPGNGTRVILRSKIP